MYGFADCCGVVIIYVDAILNVRDVLRLPLFCLNPFNELRRKTAACDTTLTMYGSCIWMLSFISTHFACNSKIALITMTPMFANRAEQRLLSIAVGHAGGNGVSALFDEAAPMNTIYIWAFVFACLKLVVLTVLLARSQELISNVLAERPIGERNERSINLK